MIKNIKIRLFGKRYNVWKDEIDSTNKEGYYIYNNKIYYIAGFIVFFVSRKKMYCMSKKTAIEWLIDEIDQMQKICDNLTKKDISLKKDVDAVLTATTLLKMKCIIAKEMEKDQIIQAYNDGKFAIINIEKNISLEQYYNETYKNEEK